MLARVPEEYDDMLCELGMRLSPSSHRARELDIFARLLFEPYARGPVDTWRAAKILIGVLTDRLDQYIGSIANFQREDSSSVRVSPASGEQEPLLAYEQLPYDGDDESEADAFTPFDIVCQSIDVIPCPERVAVLREEGSSPSVRVSPELGGWSPFESDGSDGFALLK